ASEEASLRALESLMTEFFHSCTTNDRKREIEELLNSFAGQPGSWRHCLYFLSNSRNEYVMMYSLTVFENLVNKMWVGVASEDKAELRSCLPKLLLSQHALLPFFIRNKLCKVIVDIGRQDWPMFYHDFFSNTLQLVQSPSLAPLGLVLLKMTSEELVCPREDLRLQQLVDIIDNVDYYLNLSTTNFISESGTLCLLALECLAHLFSWIPLSSSITPALLASIFHFARFGCQLPVKTKPPPTSNGDSSPGNLANGSNAQGRTGQMVGHADRARLGVMAMSCINELMCKNCVPLDFEEFLLRMFQQTFYLLQRLTNSHSHTNTHSVKNRLQELDERLCLIPTDNLFNSHSLNNLVEVTCYGSQISLYDVEMAVPSVLKPDLIDVHAQSLAALQAYSHWLAQFCSEVQRQQDQTQFVDLITSGLAATTPLINAKVTASVWHTLFSYFHPVVKSVCWCVFVLQAHVLVCRALSNMLLLPWPSLPEAEQQWPNRSANHTRLISTLTHQYRLLPRPPDHHPTSKVVLQQTLCVLKDIVDSISGEATKSRQICYQSLQESVQVTLALFPLYIQQPDVTDEMLSFFLTLFQALRVQMGVAFTEQIIQTFLSMFTREQLAVSILQEGSSGSKVVQKFLKILQVVVQEPGQTFKPMLPSILSLCMEQVYPIVAERSCPDVKAEMFELLFQILHQNWRFFFKTSVLSSVQRTGAEEHMENQAQFIAAMQAFGQSFLQPDIHIFKQNLSYLEILNSKHKLYHRKLFRSSMLFHFINVLLQVLLHKSHDLLQDDITVALYNMAAVDFQAFYSSFLPEFLNGCQGLDPHQRTTLARNFTPERDLPSFSQGVYRLVNDLRFYRLCNGSLPPGTLKL
uniref:Exportin 6 n=1 Tax=Astyanax mexicanus TaxID=7994 RepID=A0A8B9H1M6_ASTMX